MHTRSQRLLLIWVAITAVLVGLWCMTASAVGGWLLGRDFGRREVAVTPALPDLGVLVVRVDRGGPADQAGVRRGMLIVAMDGAHVEDARDLRKLLLAHRPGDLIELTVLDEHGRARIEVQLDAFPNDPERPYLGIFFTARSDDGPGDL